MYMRQMVGSMLSDVQHGECHGNQHDVAWGQYHGDAGVCLSEPPMAMDLRIIWRHFQPVYR